MGVSLNRLAEIDDTVYTYIYTHDDGKGVRISYKELSRQIDYTESTIKDSLRRLSECHRILIIKDTAHGIYNKGEVRLMNTYKIASHSDGKGL